MVEFFDPAKEIDAKRRRQFAAALQQQAQSRPTEVIGGYAVPQSKFEGIARGLAGIAGNYQNAQADQMEAGINQKRQEMLAAAVGKMGTNPQEAANILIQDPQTMQAGLGIYTDAIDANQRMQELQMKEALRNQQWERDAALKRELAAIRNGQMVVDPDTGEIVPGAGAAPSKPLPVGALTLQDEITQSLSGASNIAKDASALAQRIRAGEVPLEPTGRIEAWARNLVGISDPESRAYADYKQYVEKLRNDTLRLNKGVQTEGDAQRALNELVAAGNDPALAAQAMEKVAQINQRAADLQGIRLNNVRQNYGLPPMDTGQLVGQPAVVGGANAQAPAGDPLSSARDAIARGAPRDAVIKRLQENGYDATGL